MAILSVLAGAAMGQEKLLVLHKTGNTLGVYDAASGKREAEIPAGVKPHEFVVSADERLAYVTAYGVDSYTDTQPGGNTIEILDLAERKPAGTIDLGKYRRPHGIEQGRSGMLYVTTDTPPSLLIVDPVKKKVVKAIQVMGQLPHMVVVTGNETRAWTSDAGSGTVSVVDLKSKSAQTWVKVGGVPMGMALSRDERRLYVATLKQNQVVWVDTVGGYVQRRIGVFGQPARVVLSPDESLLLASLMESGEVAAIDMKTLSEVIRYPAGAQTEGLSLMPGGKYFYAAAQGDNKVLRFRLPVPGSPARPDTDPALVIETAGRPDATITWRGGAIGPRR